MPSFPTFFVEPDIYVEYNPYSNVCIVKHAYSGVFYHSEVYPLSPLVNDLEDDFEEDHHLLLAAAEEIAQLKDMIDTYEKTIKRLAFSLAVDSYAHSNRR